MSTQITSNLNNSQELYIYTQGGYTYYCQDGDAEDYSIEVYEVSTGGGLTVLNSIDTAEEKWGFAPAWPYPCPFTSYMTSLEEGGIRYSILTPIVTDIGYTYSMVIYGKELMGVTLEYKVETSTLQVNGSNAPGFAVAEPIHTLGFRTETEVYIYDTDGDLPMVLEGDGYYIRTPEGIVVTACDYKLGYEEAWPVNCPFVDRLLGAISQYEWMGEMTEELEFSEGLWFFQGNWYSIEGNILPGLSTIIGVHPYSTNVPTHLEWDIPDELCLGIEAEFSAFNQGLIDMAISSFEGKAMFKWDSSCGIELVTVPLPPEDMLSFIDNIGIHQMYADSNCGVHIHISRKYLSQSQLGGLVVFMNHPDNLWYIETIAGRSPNRYCKHLPGKEDTISNDRYEMVNLTNSQTVEIRIFAGTNSTITLRGYVEWLLDLIEWLDSNPLSFSAEAFIAYNN
jgi:hypothetical protein